MEKDDLLNVDEAAKFLGVSKPTLYRMIGQDAINGVKVGKRWRFRTADLTAYLQRSPDSVPAAPEDVLDAEISFFGDELTKFGSRLPDLEASVAPIDETRDPTDSAERKTFQLAGAILMLSIAQWASDIHLEPTREENEIKLRLRIRIDGVLHDIRTLPAVLREPLIGRFKIMADMNVAEKRVPQDGRLPVKVMNGHDYDLRLSTIPSIHGESLVMRVLAKSQINLDLGEMSLLPHDRTAVDTLLAKPNGLILCTGPTGSGKTTLLYAMVHALTRSAAKLISIEDPVEYALPGMTQMQVNVRAGLTFSSAFRAVFRHDPDVILVGELRDAEIARMAMEAALTGHLVLSTLHTKGAVDAIIRLRDIGIEPFYVSGALAGITAQRLCRRLCTDCRIPAKSPAGDPIWSRVLEVSADGGWKVPADAVFYKGEGCEKCRGKGYRGRIAIYEVLTMSEKLAVANAEGADSNELRALAVEDGMTTLWADGIRKASEGLTTIEEVARVVGFAAV